MTQPGDPPSALEQRGTELGITFTRGRTWTSNSLLALEAAEALDGSPHRDRFFTAMFEAYFTRLEDIGTVDAIVTIADSAGIPSESLREVLTAGTHRQAVLDALAMARRMGISAVPTFVIDGKYAVVGAQPAEVFRQVFDQLGKKPRAAL